MKNIINQKNYKNPKLGFNKDNEIQEFYSQSGQDIFVLMCMGGKMNGTFLDLGCNHPEIINNTFLLEKTYSWSGVSIDINPEMTQLYDNRKTIILTEDCTNLDFDKISTHYQTNHIDYLSLDLEPASVTLDCLKKIPFNDLSFSVITYEHDSYRFGEFYKDESRKIFESYGYLLICSDVSNDNNIYEDWYVNPKFIGTDTINILKNSNKNWDEMIFSN